ncbi:MAG TPA: SurA N-terminal domain-containing protein [Gallionella sp.]
MFDFVHEKKRFVQIVLAIIILPFAFWGVDSYTRSGNTAEVAATVNGAKISQQELGNALRQQQDRLRQQMGDNFDPAMLDSQEMKRAVIENLVAQRLMLERARNARLAVTDEQVARLIGGIEAFQDGGKFDKKRYEAALANQGMSPLAFEARLRDDMLWQQIQDAYLQNGYASSSVAENIIRLNEQQRIVSVSAVSFQPYIAQAKVDEDALKNYYNQNMQEFQVREQAKVEYVKFTMDDLLSRIDVSNEEVRNYYDEHRSEFGTPEERRAAHILIAVPAGASQAQQDTAREKSEQLLQQVSKTPARFAELAKLNSQDPGSAANGGDLGFVGRGVMVKPFEDAVFALKPGEISALVKSDFGYHIIKLIAVKPSRDLPFEEARDDILTKLRQQKSADKFAELAEKFSSTVYEQSDTLKPAADLIGARTEQSGWLVNGVGAGDLWTAKMLQAIFNDEVVKNKRNTAAIEVAPNTLVAARVLEHKPAAVRAFAEVQEVIRQKLLHQHALELAAVQGKAMLAQLQSGGKPKLNWGQVQTITRAQYGSLDPGLVKKIFQANPASLPQYVGIEAERQGYLMARIDAVKDGDQIGEEKRSRYAQQLRQLTGEEMFRAYLSDARQSASIKMNLSEDVPAQP